MYNSDLYESFWITLPIFLRTLKSSSKIAQPVKATNVKPVNHIKETGKSFIVEASLDILGLQHFCFQETRLWQAKYSTLGPVLYMYSWSISQIWEHKFSCLCHFAKLSGKKGKISSLALKYLYFFGSK